MSAIRQLAIHNIIIYYMINSKEMNLNSMYINRRTLLALKPLNVYNKIVNIFKECLITYNKL